MFQNLSRKVVALLCGLVVLGSVAAISAAAADEVIVNAASLPRDGLVKVKTLPGNYSLHVFMKAGQMKDLVVKDSAGRVCPSLNAMSISTSYAVATPATAKSLFGIHLPSIHLPSIHLPSFKIPINIGRKCFKLPAFGTYCVGVQVAVNGRAK